ncbi:hypothetical protein [Clostridium sp. D53t1_180928_C8]|uniref:hypothetical protein n=1 Tax=Clostridium sp. D53t1_180928_C8 TaxID=2787101 RepID=UPI0018A9B1CE|nr:hypothetical protein [Clostridium sp. D53t1_180928_C8]
MVKDILKLESLSSMEMIAGAGGIERYIDWIYVAECFDDPLESILESDKKIKVVNSINIIETYFKENCNVISTSDKLLD